jgi:hypothetical protein
MDRQMDALISGNLDWIDSLSRDELKHLLREARAEITRNENELVGSWRRTAEKLQGELTAAKAEIARLDAPDQEETDN